NAITALKTAGEKPESRDQQLAQAKRLLSDAILQDKQDANPAAWYYLGRLAVITSDDGEAAEVVPGGGVRVLFILEDRVAEEALCLSELLVARLGLLARGFQCRYRVVNLRVGR